MAVWRAWMAGLLVAVAAGCAGEPTPLAFSDPVAGSVEEPMMVVTTRRDAADRAYGYSGERAKGLRYAEVYVLIPPEREIGQVSYPLRSFNPHTDFTTHRFWRDMDRAVFTGQLNARLEARAIGERDVFVFVHGYNTDFAESVFLHAQIAHDFKAAAVPVSFSWASAGVAPAYLYDRESMQLARDGLAETLRMIARSDAHRIILMGHSMGGALVMETLRQLSLEADHGTLERLGPVILASPDIDETLFYQQFDRIDPRPEQFIMFVSRRDPALQVSAQLRGGAQRVGTGDHIDQLTARGITVIDLTPVGGSRIDEHTRFANSPLIINMIRDAGAVRGSFERGPDEGLVQWGQEVGELGASVANIVRRPER